MYHIFPLSNFQYKLFILQLYKIIMKEWMLRFASFRICNNTSLENFANNLDLEDIRDILNQRKKNGSSSFRYIRYSSFSQFIHAIDAITKALPHTNASARKNKNVGECLQHHFGIATLFITISPDDENNFLIQVWCREDIKDMTFYMMIMFYIARLRSILIYKLISQGFVHYFLKRCLM